MNTKKKYFLGWLPAEAQSRFFGEITKDVANKFALNNVAEKHPFHLTAKAPFSANDDQIRLMSEKLQSFALGLPEINLSLDGWGHMGNSAIYADIVPDPSCGQFIEIQKNLFNFLFKHCPWMDFSSLEPLTLPHITVTKDDVNLKCVAVLEYLRENYRTAFVMRLTELCLFQKRDDGIWVTQDMFLFR